MKFRLGLALSSCGLLLGPQRAHAQTVDLPPDSAPAAPPTDVSPTDVSPTAPPAAATPTLVMAHAATPPAPAKPPTAQSSAAETIEQRHVRSRFAFYAAGAGSVTSPALAGMGGIRFRLSDRWVVGLDGEYNAWIGLNSGRVRAGAANVYGVVHFRVPLQFASLNLRTTLQLGTAIQLAELYGAPRGSAGVFVGFNPLGLEYKLSGHVYAILYPLGVALPITQLDGAPFAYPQYRATLGVEISL